MFEENYSSDEQTGDERALNGNGRHQSDTPPSPSPCPSSQMGEESDPEIKPIFPTDDAMSETESPIDYPHARSGGKTVKLPQQSYADSDGYSPSPSPSPSPSEDDDSEYFEPSAKRPKKEAVRRKRVIQSESEEEGDSQIDDSDDWTPSARRAPKTKRRVKKPTSAKPSRTSGRVQKKANYNEDEFDEDSQSYLEDSSPVKAQPEVPEGDVIESIHDYRFLDSSDEKFPYNIEFLIKWQNWSHMHSTWETYIFLKDFKGIKKVENYIKNVAGPDLALRNDPDANREDLEQRNITVEMDRNVLRDYSVVERIIARREVTPSDEAESGLQYFCKWKRLGYSACTWEPVEILTSQFQSEIDGFLERDQSRLVPSRGVLLDKRSVFKKLSEQPEYLVGGTLRDYQLTGINWMAYLWSKNKNGILADEMGLGKTIQTISFISYLFHTMQVYGPFLVVVPLSTIGAWEREFVRWAPDMNTVCYTGDNRSRTVIRDYEFYVNGSKKIKFNVLLTTFELVLKDRAELGAIKWSFLAVDEAHRLKNSESQLHECLKSFSTANRLLITGTPLQNSIRELCALVHFLNPDIFDISDSYDTLLTDDSEGQQAKIAELHKKINPYMLRRLKKDVEKSLPKKTELIVRVDLTQMQMTYYKNILTKNFSALNKGVAGGNQLSLLNICAELKKASNHPYLFPNAEEMGGSRSEQLRGIIANSGKMELLDKLLTRMRENGSRVLIFSQMVRLLDILADYMALKGYTYQRLDGSVGSEARKKSIEHFNAPGSPDFVFLLSTRAGGLGINLETADTVIIFDSDWNPQNDLQAMARAHRIGQRKHVNVYRFVSRGTMEEDILERAKRKMVLEYCVISQMDTSGQTLLQKDNASKSNPFSKEELQAILKFGAARMFQDNEARKGAELSLDDILAQAEQHETTEGQTSINGGEEFLKQFEVADYEAGKEMSWEEIIPEDERLRLQQEEESLQAEGLLTSRKRKKVNYQEDGHHHHHVPRDTLKERDIRAIYRGILKFGHLPERLSMIIEEGQLSHLDKSIITDSIGDLVAMCHEFEEREGPLQPKKAYFLTYKGVDGINVSQILQRTHDFGQIYRYLRKAQPDSFRLPFNPKPVAWTVEWDHVDDGMLLLGIFQHGFGNWGKIRENPSLGLTDRLFLSEADSPGSTPRTSHLVRRGEYLLKTYADYIEEKRRKKEFFNRPQAQPSSAKVKVKAKPPSPKKQPSIPQSPSLPENTCLKMLRPVKTELRRLRDESSHMAPDHKVDLIKECVVKIGKLIDRLSITEEYCPEALKTSLWVAVTRFWPKAVPYKKIMDLYNKLSN